MTALPLAREPEVGMLGGCQPVWSQGGRPCPGCASPSRMCLPVPDVSPCPYYPCYEYVMVLKGDTKSSGKHIRDREQCCETKWVPPAGDLGEGIVG